jgi:hypothetical protein
MPIPKYVGDCVPVFTLLEWSSMRVALTAVFFIRCYRGMIRGFLIGSCKFFPSCSEYAIEALQVHGFWRGSVLAARRLCRCHPFSPGGIDPVPERGAAAKS